MYDAFLRTCIMIIIIIIIIIIILLLLLSVSRDWLPFCFVLYSTTLPKFQLSSPHG